MDLRQIRYFIAVADAGNFLRAASRLRVSQPALSKTIRGLEDALQVKLFERGARGVTLTVFGKTLYDYGRAVMAELNRASHELQAMRSMPAGSITIGSLRTAASMLLPDVTAKYAQKHPDVRIKIVENYNSDLIMGLARGDFDFIIGIVEGNLAERGFRYEPLFHDRLAIVARKGHPLCARKRVAPAALTRYPWVLPSVETLIRRRLEEMFYSADVTPPLSSIESGSLQYMRSLLARSDYLAILPECSVRLDVELGILSLLPMNSEFMLRPIGLIFHPNHVLPQAARNLIQDIREACSEHLERDPSWPSPR